MINRSIQPFFFRMVGLVTGFFICTFFFGCSPSHIINYKEALSRDYIYIDFVRNPDPFQMSSEVGGEHIHYIKILGFEGDKYLVELEQLEGDATFSISGPGVDVIKIQPHMETALVRGVEALVSVGVSAHPYGEYTLTITKL